MPKSNLKNATLKVLQEAHASFPHDADRLEESPLFVQYVKAHGARIVKERIEQRAREYCEGIADAIVDRKMPTEPAPPPPEPSASAPASPADALASELAALGMTEPDGEPQEG